ncbi:MAG: HPr family phosphocarrier protein [Oscillospiraceae bacterium]|nr:HPr family phosphocarrier protein [Oscillospiraceae bacterium]
MISKRITIPCECGIAHHIATQFVKTANEYHSTLRIDRGDGSVNAKSLLGVLAMGITKDEQIVLTAEGPDENAAMEALERLFR